MKKLAQNLTLSISAVFLTLVVLEIVVRLLSPYPFTTSHYPAGIGGHNKFIHSTPFHFDPELGYVPRANWNHYAHPSFGYSPLTIYKDRTRSNLEYVKSPDFNQPHFDPRTAILAVGDSFTQGVEVGNTDTWPALLEREIGIRVINGGVSGYSTLQAILRGERLIKQLHIRRLIISLIPEDINRSEYSFRYGAAAPYMKESGQGFKLATDHIRKLKKPTPEEKDNMKRLLNIFGRSFLIMELMNRISTKTGSFIYYGGWKRENNVGDLGVCALISQLADFKEQNDIQVMFVLQYNKAEINAKTSDLGSFAKKNII